MKNKICEVCGQKTDVYTGVHKKHPFVDGRNYGAVCFTCYFVPKTTDQKYDKDGSLEEEVSLPYSCQHLQTARDLHDQGASDTLRYAQACVEAVKGVCKGVRPPKKPTKRPEASWNVC